MVEEIKRKKFFHWILSLHAIKFYEAKVDSFYMGKLLIKINIVQTQVLEKPIHKLLSCFWKQVFSRLLIRFFLGGNGTNQLHVNALTHVSFIFWYAEVGSRYSLYICCKILNSQLLFAVVLFQMWRFVRQMPERPWKWCVNLFTLKS